MKFLFWHENLKFFHIQMYEYERMCNIKEKASFFNKKDAFSFI